MNKTISEGPDLLGAVVTDAQRVVDSVERYVAAAQALKDYITSLIAGPCPNGVGNLPLANEQQQAGDWLCNEYPDLESPEARECLTREIEKYGIDYNVLSSFKLSGKNLLTLLHALETVGQRIVECLNTVASADHPFCSRKPGSPPNTISPQAAFKNIFEPKPTKELARFSGACPELYDKVQSQLNNWLSSKEGLLQIMPREKEEETGFTEAVRLYDILILTPEEEKQIPSCIPNIVVKIIILLPFAKCEGEILERIIRHEAGHAFLNLLEDTFRYGNKAEYVNENTKENKGKSFSGISEVIVDYLGQIQGEYWIPDQSYTPGMIIDPTSGITEKAIQDIISEYYHNASLKNGASPKEDYADTFSLYTELISNNNTIDDTTYNALVSSSRVQFFQDNFCCWVWELLDPTRSQWTNYLL